MAVLNRDSVFPIIQIANADDWESLAPEIDIQ